MDSARWRRIQDVFEEVAALEPAMRERVLTARCADDQALRAEVEALLKADSSAGAFLSTPAGLSETAQPEDLTGRSIGPYEIRSPLGAGGMGEVYLATDRRLNRPVAIKLLPRDVSADPQRLARFQDEARAASALNHPNIVVVHDVGTADDGRSYLVTEFVDGETLRARLSGGPLPPGDAVAIAGQIASALAAAHARGIVHRDIKPENVIVRPDGHVKVVDFGLAKLAVRDGGDPAATLRTTPGLAIGTPRYMSPEQARGLDVDLRSDLWSLGVVLFEMLEGRAPFVGETTADVLAAILERPVPPLTAAPAALGRVATKALSKQRDGRFASADDMRIALVSAGGDRSPAPARVALALAAAAVAAVAVAAFAWRWNSAAARTSSVAAAVRPAAVADATTRVVVLPFENLTRRPEDDWLSDGIADTLTYGLHNLEGFTSISRERVAEIYRAEGVKESAPLAPGVPTRVATLLGAAFYVHGTYERTAGGVRVVARLVAAGSGSLKAEQSAAGSLDDILTLEDDLARRVAVALGGPGARPARGSTTTSVEAFQAFTEGRSQFATDHMADASRLLHRAVEIDPGYVQAWALLSKAESRLDSPSRHMDDATALQHRNEAVRAAQRAVSLDPSYDGAHAALALAYRGAGQIGPWRTEAQRAIELNPRSSEAYVLLGDSYTDAPIYSCSRTPNPVLAEEFYRTAIRLDPRDTIAHMQLANHLAWLRPRDAEVALTQLFALLPDSVVGLMVRSILLLDAHRTAEARTVIARLDPAVTFARLLAAYADLMDGKREAAARTFDAATSEGRAPWPALTTLHMVFHAGDIELSKQYLARAVAIDPACAAFVQQSALFAPIRGNAELRQLLTTPRAESK